MNSRQRRLRAIELSLTPRQVVIVWLKDAMQAGTIVEGVRHSPPHRSAIANTVLRTVQSSMKGQSESLIEQAVLQARREADSLYLLIINANMATLEGWEQRKREYVFLLGYLIAESNGKITMKRLQMLRLVVLGFIKSVIILDAAIAKVVSEHLEGQPMLFRDSEEKLKKQVELAEKASEIFNFLARSVGSAEMDLEELRKILQSETDRMVSIWVDQARVGMLALFGTVQEVQAALGQGFLLCGPESGEPNSLEVSINTAGEITGSYIDANNAYHRFVYDANGARTEFDAPGVGTGGGQELPKGWNSANDSVNGPA
jgi:YD repeat-containing protein